MRIVERNLRVVLLAFLALSMTPARAQAPAQPSAPSDAEVKELEQRVESLRKEIDQLEAAKDAATQQRLMQENWRGMQDYMGWMHNRWGAGSPWMMGPGMMQGRGWMDCPMMGGSSAAWPVPEGMSPEQYGQQMDEHMKRMQEQMNQLGQTTDPQQRQKLLQEHWQTMYRDMESMRGMGWMHGPMMGPGMMGPGMMGGARTQTQPPPDPGSAGAKLVSSYCTQCHAVPPPTLHTSSEWASVVGRMDLHMNDGTMGFRGIRTPSKEEMQTILAYMQKNAR